MNGFPILVVFPLALAGAATLAVLSFRWHVRRTDEIASRWAARNDLVLIDSEYRWFLKGPFWWRAGDQHGVLRVSVRERCGRRRTGWLRCGGWFLGLWSDDATVEWDD